MKTIKITLDDELAIAVDKLTKRLKTTRSAFIRNALHDSLLHYERHCKKADASYDESLLSDDQNEIWNPDQVWSEE